MPDPSDHSDPALEAAGSGPARSPIPTVADRDGGVARRVSSRCRIGASVLAGFAAVCLLFVTLRTFTAGSAVLVLLAAGSFAGAVLLLRRARLWSTVAGSPVTGGYGAEAIVGQPRPLSPGIPGAPLKRRLGAKVVPIHAASGPQPGGGALVVHARADGSELADGDVVRVRSAAAAARASTEVTFDDIAPLPTSGRYVLYRETDGTAFLATTRLADTW